MAGMPWKECRAMSEKVQFVERAEKGERVAALCREFGVSRETGHKWIKRFKEGGYEALQEQSRRPKTTPLPRADAEQAHHRSHSSSGQLGPRATPPGAGERDGACAGCYSACPQRC